MQISYEEKQLIRSFISKEIKNIHLPNELKSIFN